MVTDSNNFTFLVGTEQFIDKTPFLKYLIDSGSIYLTAPARFGKSTLLKMTQTFFGGRFNSSGHITTTADNVRSVFTNPQRFDKNTTALKIYKDHKNFFELHFQSYSVLFINFAPLSDTEDHLSFKYGMCTVFKNVIFDLREHFFTIPSDDACIEFKKTLQYVPGAQFITECVRTFHSMKTWLQDLSLSMLYCFKREVVIVADEYDAILQAVMTQNIPSSDLKQIAKDTHRVCTSACKGNKAVRITLAMGILNLSGMSTSQANNVRHRDFFSHKKLGEYFGFQEDEVNIVLKRYGLEGKHGTVARFYDGYRVAGCKKGIYNTGSILNFCNDRGNMHAATGWLQLAGWHKVLNPLFSDVAFGTRMFNSLKGNITIDVVTGRLDYEPLLDLLKKIRSDGGVKHSYDLNKEEQDMVFQYFLQSGYYTLTEGTEFFTPDVFEIQQVTTKCQVTMKPTNQETWCALFRALAQSKYLEFIFGVTRKETDAFFEALSSIKSGSELEFEKLLKSVHALTRGQKLKKEIDLQVFVYFACKMLQIDEKFLTHEIELTLKNGHVIDAAVLPKGSYTAVLIELECFASAYAGIKQIVRDDHFTVFKEASFRNYDIRHVALIGLRCKSIKQRGGEKTENQCSLCYLFGDKFNQFDHEDLKEVVCLAYPDDNGKIVRKLTSVQNCDKWVKVEKQDKRPVFDSKKKDKT